MRSSPFDLWFRPSRLPHLVHEWLVFRVRQDDHLVAPPVQRSRWFSAISAEGGRFPLDDLFDFRAVC